MKRTVQYAAYGLCLLAATLLLAACGGSSSATTTIPPTVTPAVSSVTPATATIGTAVSVTVTGTNLPLTAVFTVQDATCASPTVNSATIITQSCTPGGTAGTKTVTVLTASGGTVIDATRTITVAAAVVAASLPDTGITSSQCYAAGSDALVSCSDSAAIALNDQQDGMITPGSAGMSYSQVGAYPLTSCVQDNKTGLIWEGKTDDGGLRDKDNTYTNYGDSRSGDASAYVTAVNATSLCGYNDWRLPTADELQMIVDYSIAYSGPTINSTWFPNTVGNAYWSASPYAGDSNFAWFVYFYDGDVFNGGRSSTYYVRLVRAGQ